MTRSAVTLIRAGTLLALLAAVLLIGTEAAPAGATQPPAPPDAAAAHTFVGTIAGAPESARIGVVCDGKSFLVYACSDDKGFNADHAAWFKGASAGDKIEAVNGARTLKATVTADTVSGELRSGDTALTFTAKRCDDHVVAGLYRAEDGDGLFGWVIDEDGFVAGGVQRPNTKGAGVVPNNGVIGGVKAPADKNGSQVAGQRVQNPAQPPKGKKVKGFSPARRAEFLARIQTKTPQNGNPLLPALIHMVKRFNTGAKPETKVEEAAFAQLRKLPKQALVDYEKNWDKIPVAVRQRLAGPELAKMDPTKALTVERMGELVKAAGIQPAAKTPRSNTAPTVSQVSIKELRALDTTGEVKDEIFAIYVIGADNQVFTKTTAVLTGIGNGDTKTFAAADRIVFPPAEQPNLTSVGDVLVTATLFEQDNNIGLVKTLVKALVDAVIVGIAIFTAPEGAAAGGFVVPANLLIDQIAAGLPDAQTLDTDTFRATPDGKLLAIGNNNVKSELKFKTAEKKGPGPFDFRLTGLDVRTKK